MKKVSLFASLLATCIYAQLAIDLTQNLQLIHQDYPAGVDTNGLCSFIGNVTLIPIPQQNAKGNFTGFQVKGTTNKTVDNCPFVDLNFVTSDGKPISINNTELTTDFLNIYVLEDYTETGSAFKLFTSFASKGNNRTGSAIAQLIAIRPSKPFPYQYQTFTYISPSSTDTFGYQLVISIIYALLAFLL
ncbi:hypothetical protein TTHERM_00488310 (macronuclear) [Tetrahymena thermophila SB210]|uniref:Transmembrane protein n=1 Tax=Tetrahymena thermophila (strain SB210) TaxID=312017 RepID=Q23JE3_TETTS|nr:hypothetical protein TTHERM_00488310 [Tetrahymena thermophila SB210]EAR96561.1 hypothetical protein TTHERM_00488310 [Tetrahymena thermophila SB210]|eukprot:XP_001016806.1 hypothetical protein TTHERM_00488310 [Tetrahymena thermophila SB210]